MALQSTFYYFFNSKCFYFKIGLLLKMATHLKNQSEMFQLARDVLSPPPSLASQSK